MRPQRVSHGFTLVELLVVIAIIGILAGLIAAGLPAAMERARITNAENNFTQIRTILTEYYTEYDSYPPMYGYITDQLRGDNRVDPAVMIDEINGVDSIPNLDGIQQVLFLLPWDVMAGIHGNEKLRDTFAKIGYDTNSDGTINRLEFAPVGEIQGDDSYTFNFNQLYLGDNGSSNNGTTLADVNRQLNPDDVRPYVYVAVNERQFRLFKRIVEDDAADPNNPRPFNLSANALQQINQRLIFPPARYDKFVLISVGPNAAIGTGGILPEFGVNGFMQLADIPWVYQYHILGLAAYFMATRDADNSGELDFEFKARTRRGEGKNPNNALPGEFPNGPGPLIYTGGA